MDISNISIPSQPKNEKEANRVMERAKDKNFWNCDDVVWLNILNKCNWGFLFHFFFTRKMVRYRNGFPWASMLRLVAHFTGCKMSWLAHIPLIQIQEIKKLQPRRNYQMPVSAWIIMILNARHHIIKKMEIWSTIVREGFGPRTS